MPKNLEKRIAPYLTIINILTLIINVFLITRININTFNFTNKLEDQNVQSYIINTQRDGSEPIKQAEGESATSSLNSQPYLCIENCPLVIP